MAFSTTIQHVEKPAPVSKTTPNSDMADALLSMLMLSVYGAQMSRKTVRKLKRQFFFTSLKLKAKSLFQPRNVSDRTLLYIIAGLAFIVLLIVSPIAALVLALLVLILILAGII